MQNNHNENKKPKHLWEDEEWDEVSPFHKGFREVSGIPLNDAMIKFYILIVVVSVISAIFLK